MRSVVWVAALLPALVLCTARPRPGQASQDHPSFYVVWDYDEGRDPAADLAEAVERAQREGKRILLVVGGEWCGWCKLLEEFIRNTPEVHTAMDASFLIVKVNWSRGNRNEAFLGQLPTIRGYPHIFVLEMDGSFLHSQNTGELEEGRSYDLGAVLGFLNRWKRPIGARVP
jgi:thiol:disulfide interchange protein